MLYPIQTAAHFSRTSSTKPTQYSLLVSLTSELTHTDRHSYTTCHSLTKNPTANYTLNIRGKKKKKKKCKVLSLSLSLSAIIFSKEVCQSFTDMHVQLL